MQIQNNNNGVANDTVANVMLSPRSWTSCSPTTIHGGLGGVWGLGIGSLPIWRENNKFMQKRERKGIIAKKKVVMSWGGERERVFVLLLEFLKIMITMESNCIELKSKQK